MYLYFSIFFQMFQMFQDQINILCYISIILSSKMTTEVQSSLAQLKIHQQCSSKRIHIYNQAQTSINVDLQQTIKQCRICLDSNQSQDSMIEPCNCTGSMRYVHFGCLKQWINTRYRSQLDNLDDENETFKIQKQCQLCKSGFNMILKKQSICHTRQTILKKIWLSPKCFFISLFFIIAEPILITLILLFFYDNSVPFSNNLMINLIILLSVIAVWINQVLIIHEIVTIYMVQKTYVLSSFEKDPHEEGYGKSQKNNVDQ